MDSLAYSESSTTGGASAVSKRSFGSDATNTLNARGQQQHQQQQDDPSTSAASNTSHKSGTTTSTSMSKISTTSSKSKGSKKMKQLLFGGLKNKKAAGAPSDDDEARVPYEKSLSFVLDQAYGKSPARPNAGNATTGDRKVIPNQYQATHHRNRSLFDGKLPTIQDESYQSSSHSTTTSARSMGEAKSARSLNSNILGDVSEEEEYDDEEYDKENQNKASPASTNSDAASMVSQEFTATTLEAEDLPYTFSVTKNVRNLTRIKLMLDQQHTSYVEGEETVNDTSDLPKENLGNLFADVNLTMSRRSMNVDVETSEDDDESESESIISVDPGVREKGGKAHSLADQDSLKEGADDSFDRFVLDRTTSKMESSKKSDQSDDGKGDEEELKGDDIDNDYNHNDGDANSDQSSQEELSDSSVEDSKLDESSLFQQASQPINDVLSESSFEDSKADDSLLFGTSAADYQSILSESSAEDSSRNALSLDSPGKNDGASASSQEDSIVDQTNEELLTQNDADSHDNLMNRTDAAIEEDNILDRTDMAIVLRDVDTTRNLDILDALNAEDEEDDESASQLLQIFKASPEVSAASTRITAPIPDAKNDESVRENSPFPIIESNSAPMAPALTNMLPHLSHDESEDDNDLYFQSKENSNLKEEEDEKMEKIVAEQFVAIKQLQAAAAKGLKVSNPYRGPEIGTLIQLVRKGPKVDQEAEKIPVTETTLVEKPSAETTLVTKDDSSKNAFSRQVANNGAFLFNGERNRLPPKDMSTVDNGRLSLLQVEKEDRRTSSASFSGVDISEDDSLETIQKKLMQLKLENKKAVSSSRHSSVSISRSMGELKITGAGIRRTVSTSNEEKRSLSDRQEPAEIMTKSATHISQSIRTVPSMIGSKKESIQDDEKKNAGGSKRSRLDAHLTSNASRQRTESPDQNRESDSASKDPTEYDDMSISDLHKKYSAITPMKTKSPHIRFKKALRMFDAHHDTEANKRINEPRKTPPRKNAAAAKEDFVFSNVTSINGRLRQNSQRSLKKKRRLTSGNDVIAPRKPTLQNPLFRDQNKINDSDQRFIDDSSVESLHEITSVTTTPSDQYGTEHVEGSSANHSHEIVIPSETIEGSSVDASKSLHRSQKIEILRDNVESSNIDDSQNVKVLNDKLDGEIFNGSEDDFSDDSSVESLKGSSCLGSEDENGMPDNEHEMESFVEDKHSESTGPYDENDELDLSPSSSASDGSALSIDEIAGIMKSAATKNSNTSFDSPVRPLTGLRSAMKSRGEKNDNNRVSWFEDTGKKDQSPLRPFEDRLVSEDSTSPSAESTSLEFNASVNPKDQNPQISNEPQRTQRKLIVYSPSHDSLASYSPMLENLVPVTQQDRPNGKENDMHSMQDSPESVSPMQTFRENAAVVPMRRQGPLETSELDLSPGPGRRTPSQNRKWTNTPSTNSPTKKSAGKKSWRELKAEHDAKKKKKLSSKKKKNSKKQRLSGMSKTSLFL